MITISFEYSTFLTHLINLRNLSEQEADLKT